MDRDRPDRRFGQPKSTADLLGAVLKTVQTKTSRSKVAMAFDAVVGEEVSKSAEVVGFRRGTLWVSVNSAPLYSELAAFRAEQIREDMNERLVSPKIARIVFRLDGTAHG